LISASLNVADQNFQVEDGYSTAFQNDSTDHDYTNNFDEPSPKRIAINNEDKGKGPAKGTCRPKMVVAEVSTLRLPVPCPLPSNFSSKVISACENDQFTGNMKLTFLREAATFYHGLCPKPTQGEYGEMAKTLCDKYPTLKDKGATDGKYPPWVRNQIK